MQRLFLYVSLVLLFTSCDLLFNTFNKEKFKGTYKVELKEFMTMAEGTDVPSKLINSLAKFAMNDVDLFFSFGDKQEGSLKIEGAAIELLSVLSDDFKKPIDFKYYFKSDSVLMIKFDSEKQNEFRSLGIIRSYDKAYQEVKFFVKAGNNSSNGRLITFKKS